MTLNLRQIEAQSVQDLPQANKQNGAIESSFWGWATQRGPILPAWGTRERERWLRLYDRNEYNTLWQGASAGLIKKIKATPYELKGGRNLTNRFDGVLRDAHFGAGWGVFISLILRDYLRFDGGAYAEIIAPGNPLKPPTGGVTGIAHLDSYHCLPTGDPEFPVVYYSRKGALHLLHHTRVLRFVDMPDGDQDHPGYGLCAQSRAIAVVQRQLYMNQYIVQNLDDKPSPGVMVANNMSKEDRDRVFAVFRQEQQTDIPPEWGKVAWVFNMNPAVKASLENVSFSRPPEKFDYPVYVNLDINQLALAIGVDKQELWELSGATGTAGQSIIQAEKSEGKAPGEIRAMLERELNNKLLPDSLEFLWKVRDGRAAQQEATTAQIWVGVGSALVPIIGAQLVAEILSKQVEAIADALTDANGQLIRIPDVDRQSADQQQPDIQATQQETVAQDDAPNAKKDFNSTRQTFIANLVDLLHGSVDEEVNRRRAGVIMRAMLNTSGKAARNDGLLEGGVTTGLSDADLNAHTVWLAQTSNYVTEFLDSVYQSGLTEAQIDQHAELWVNKSLQAAYFDGIQSADANGAYEFYGSDGKESCPTCRSLKGTKMRMSEWAARKLRPGVDTDSYVCGGWNCQHGLRRVQSNG